MKQDLRGYPDVPREARARLDGLSRLIRDEALVQNLVSKTTLADFEARHIADSAQLSPLLADGPVVDIGTGAGLPGLVLAILVERHFVLVEPRRKRADFLARAIDILQLSGRVEVFTGKVEALNVPPVASITARAVAALDSLFGMAIHLASPATRWVLPKGRTAIQELAAARRSWHGEFRLVPSLTDPDAAIVIAERVRRRA